MKIRKITVGLLSLLLIIGAIYPTLSIANATVYKTGWSVDFSSGQSAIDENVFFDSSLKTTGLYSESDSAAVFTSSESNLSSATRTPGIILGGTVTSTSDKELSVLDSSVTEIGRAHV